MTVPYGKYSAFLAATVLMLSMTLFFEPIVHVDGAVPPQPNPGDYIVTEYDINVLSKVTPGGVRTITYTFADGTGPASVAIDSSGNYIVTETSANVLSKITPSGVRTVIYTFAGGTGPNGVAIDSSGSYIVAEQNIDVLSKITPGGIRTVIYTFVAFTGPFGVAIDSAGNYVVTEFNNFILSKVTPGGVRTVIFNFPAGSKPFGLAIDFSGNYIVTEYFARVLSKITPGGVRTVILTFAAGTFPAGVAIDSGGNYIVAEASAAPVLSKITPSGVRTVISTFPTPSEFFGVVIVPTPTSVVTFDTVPANTGTITFDGASFSDGNTVSKTSGAYTVTANPAAGYAFSKWETSGGVSVADPNSATTTCTISGDGTLRMAQTRSGCVVATAAYGSELAPEVTYMRHVRDNMIGSNHVGRMLVDGWNTFYYSWSPPIAEWITNSKTLQAAFRILLLPLIATVHLTAFIYTTTAIFNLTLASVIAFLFATISSMALYVVIPVISFRAIYKKIHSVNCLL